MVKINLKALQNDASSLPQEEISEVKTEEIISEVKKEEVKEKAERKSGVKISLKDLNIKPANNNNAVVEDKKVETNDETTEIKSVESEKVDLTETKKVEIEEVKEIISEEKQEESQEKKVEVFAISDGDTNCNIIQDKKLEIFSNYKGSYAPKAEKKKEEEKVEVISDKITELEEAKVETEIDETIQIKTEEQIQEISEITEVEEKEELVEIKAEEQILTQDSNEVITEKVIEEKTNLEKYKEGSKENKKLKNILKNKKVLIPSVFVFIFAVVGGIISTLNFKDIPPFKANIQEIQGVKESKIPKTEITNNVSEGLDNKEPNIMNEDLNKKVNENITPNVDNTPKTNTMNNGIENYLIRKYKTN